MVWVTLQSLMESTLMPLLPLMKLKVAKVQNNSHVLLYSFNDCSITVSSCLILAVCSPMNMNGFQMIVQSSNSSEVHKLHVNQNVDLQTPVAVEVDEGGVYQVTIII